MAGYYREEHSKPVEWEKRNQRWKSWNGHATPLRFNP